MKSFTINHSPKRIDNHSDIGSGKGREGPEERGMKYAFLTSGATWLDRQNSANGAWNNPNLPIPYVALSETCLFLSGNLERWRFVRHGANFFRKVSGKWRGEKIYYFHISSLLDRVRVSINLEGRARRYYIAHSRHWKIDPSKKMMKKLKKLWTFHPVGYFYERAGGKSTKDADSGSGSNFG